LIRGLAALAVLIFHVRYRFFFDYHDVSSPDPFATLFFVVTAFGHDAVVVFFVLSGYFISASVLRDCATGSWSWQRYAANRATRLYTVLVPGLVLTLIWDQIGLGLFSDNPVYTGAARAWQHDFFPVRDRLDAGTFGANLLFLQTVVSPPFGSNDALWSLSYEFWYYVLFPIGWLALTRPMSLRKRTAYLVIVAALLVALGRSIAIYFPVWLLGTAVCLLPQLPALKRRSALAGTAAVCLFCGIVLFTHTGFFRTHVSQSIVVIDYVTGLSFASVLYVLLHDRRPAEPGRYVKVAKLLAGLSYTLYVTHLPFLVFLRAALVPDAPWLPDPFHVGVGVVIALVALGYAFVVFRLAEAKTDRVRAKLTGCRRTERLAPVQQEHVAV